MFEILTWNDNREGRRDQEDNVANYCNCKCCAMKAEARDSSKGKTKVPERMGSGAGG
jgi:hypothetical protein